MQGVNICPEHNCRLLDSTVLISRKASPMLCAAEAYTDNGAEITVCSNQTELELARYVAEVFRQGINTNVAVGQYLHSKLEGTKYISPRGQRRNMKLLAEDFCTFYDECSESTMKELWQLQKVFTGGKWGLYEVCQLALFLGISPSELCNMKLPDQSQTERFDGEIIRLRELGLSYPQIAKRLGASTSAVKAIGEKGEYSRKTSREKPKKPGRKRKDWQTYDEQMLPLIKEAIDHMQKVERPIRITRHAIEKVLQLKPKQLDNMPFCNAEIMRHAETQQQYWTREILWAYHIMQETGQTINWEHLRQLTNIRKENLAELAHPIGKQSGDRVG